jgi:regulator of RNase E activity RraA
MPATLTKEQAEFLKSMDTPTVCNVIEMVAPERRGHGYTVKHLFCPFPDLPPIVGFAKTVTAKAKDKVSAGDYMAKRMDYLDYVASEPRPSISVIEDLDDEVGYGAFWGEVQSNIHKALGSIGCVTNGSFRDLDMWAEGYQMVGGRIGPSHAWVHMVDFGRAVNIFGMQVGHDDVIHADYHGAVVVPADAVKKLPAAIDLISRREKVILDFCRDPGFTPAKLRVVLKRSAEIH